MKARDIAPNFVLKDQIGQEFELYKNLGKNLLLVFYPKDNTPVCSRQLKQYNDDLEKFIERDVKIIGISADSIKSHSEFCGKLKLKFQLLSDGDKQVHRLYNAVNFLRMTKRLLVLVGTNRKILWLDSSFGFTYIKSGDILEKINVINISKMT